MARYRRRYRTIVRAPKKKWASNIVSFVKSSSGSVNLQYATQTIVSNSTQAASPTPVIVKAGNFKVQGDVYVTGGSGQGPVAASMYIIYLPEGVTINSADGAKNVIAAHPEWILTWKYVSYNRIGTGEVSDNQTFSFSSRLKRNLNSGDSIILLCLVEGTSIGTGNFGGMAQYWTCAN